MYRIIKVDGTELGITDSVIYIRIGSSGNFTPCSAEDAIGVAFGSVPYNLVGHSEIEGAEAVVVSRVDGGLLAFEQKASTDERLTDVENAMCEQDSATDERLTNLEDALCELDSAMNRGGEN